MEVKDMRARLDENRGKLNQRVEQYMYGRKQPVDYRLGQLLLLLTMIELQIDRVEQVFDLHHLINEARAFFVATYGEDSQPELPDDSQEHVQKIEEAFASFEELLDG